MVVTERVKISVTYTRYFNFMHKSKGIQFRIGIWILHYKVLKDIGALHLTFCHPYNVSLVLQVQRYGIYGLGSMTDMGRKEEQWLCTSYLLKGISRNCQKTYSFIQHWLMISLVALPNWREAANVLILWESNIISIILEEREDIGEKLEVSLKSVFIATFLFFSARHFWPIF